MYANLVILLYLGSPFTWDQVFKVLRLLPNHIKKQKLLVHILYNISFLNISFAFAAHLDWQRLTICSNCLFSTVNPSILTDDQVLSNKYT